MVSIVEPTKTAASQPEASQASGAGRIKAPVCVFSSLKEESMTTEELLRSTFKTEDSAVTPSLDTANVVSDVVPVSSSSSTCTRESDPGAFSDIETSRGEQLHKAVSDRMNAAVSSQKTSRQGRATQRWITDTETNESIRLVTGCVPILKGGKILFVSANRKPEWILPKGGWELDETMEESAVRECFEEAGVLGVLGPKLTMVQYETRKAKKRRLEQAETGQKRAKADSDMVEGQDSFKVPATLTSKEQSSPSGSSVHNVAVLSDEAMSRIREVAQDAPRASEETASVASSRSSAPYSQVRMTLFPLYVSSVADSWPERGRFRKAVDIDEAIKMLSYRPEFKTVLMEVRQRGLHLVPSPSHR